MGLNVRKGRGRAVAVKEFFLIAVIGMALAGAEKARAADDSMVTKAAPVWSDYSGAYNWTGFYAGGNFGVGWGKSNWTAGPGISGSTDLFQTIDTFNEGGSFFAGVQGGYNYMLPNRVLLGVEADASFPAWPTLPSGVNPFGVSVGGSTAFTSPTLGRSALPKRCWLPARYGADRLRARALAVLRDRWIRLDIRSAIVDPGRHRNRRNAVRVAVGLGGRSWR